MKAKSIISSLVAVVLTLLLALAVPDAFAKGGGKGGGRERSHQFRSPGVHHRSHHDRRHNYFFFGFGGHTVVPAWGSYAPYYSWGPSPYYPYYSHPYADYYGYPYYPDYRSDPCLSPDSAYAPYCPPTADNLPQGYHVPPVDYPSPPTEEDESQFSAPLQQPPSPLND